MSNFMALAGLRIDASRVVEANGLLPVALSDATDPTRQLAIDASGRITVTGSVTTDTEFPAASALNGDGVVSPTTTVVGTFGYGFNGTTWDRLRTYGAVASFGNVGIAAAGLIGYDVANDRYTPLRAASKDADSNGYFLGSGGMVFNGSTWDRVRSMQFGSDLVLGVLATAPTVIKNGSAAFARPFSVKALLDGADGDTWGASTPYAFNGTNYDRLRSGAFTASATVTGRLNTLPLGVYNSSAPTLTNGQYSHVQLDVSGNTNSNLGTLLAGENQTDNRLMVEAAWTTASITTQTTTQVKSGAGKLGGLLIPTPVANATIKVYDNTAASGTVLVDTITLPGTLISDGPIYLPFFGKTFSTGCCVVTAGATMAVDIDYL